MLNVDEFMHACRLVVCEPQPRWSRLLRPIARDVGIQLREVRGLEQIWPVVEEAPSSVVCLHVTGNNVTRCMAAAHWIKQNHPVTLVALPIRACGPWAWRMYECGVDQVVHSPLDLRSTATMIRRHTRRSLLLDDFDKITEESYHDQLWKRLPWKRHAMGGGG